MPVAYASTYFLTGTVRRDTNNYIDSRSEQIAPCILHPAWTRVNSRRTTKRTPWDQTAEVSGVRPPSFMYVSEEILSLLTRGEPSPHPNSRTKMTRGAGYHSGYPAARLN